MKYVSMSHVDCSHAAAGVPSDDRSMLSVAFEMADGMLARWKNQMLQGAGEREGRRQRMRRLRRDEQEGRT